jgi:hypothetical protein
MQGGKLVEGSGFSHSGRRVERQAGKWARRHRDGQAGRNIVMQAERGKQALRHVVLHRAGVQEVREIF